jgi:hypothetical protein
MANTSKNRGVGTLFGMVPKLMPKNFQDWKYVVVNRSFLSKAFQG